MITLADPLGRLIASIARRRLEAEIQKGGGRVLVAVIPIVRPIAQAEARTVDPAAVKCR